VDNARDSLVWPSKIPQEKVPRRADARRNVKTGFGSILFSGLAPGQK